MTAGEACEVYLGLIPQLNSGVEVTAHTSHGSELLADGCSGASRKPRHWGLSMHAGTLALGI